jgi:hypothetical protein
MFRFHPVFWLLMALFFIVGSRRRRWSRRWEMVGPMGYAPFGWGPRGGDWGRQPQPVPATPQALAQPDRTLVESLESRIAELEQRLEFAERLMASKKEQ